MKNDPLTAIHSIESNVSVQVPEIPSPCLQFDSHQDFTVKNEYKFKEHDSLTTNELIESSFSMLVPNTPSLCLQFDFCQDF